MADYDKLNKQGKISDATLKRMKKKRTPGGSVKAPVREKTATISKERFPIFDKKSAMAALKLRGHGTTPEERAKIIRRAGKFVPVAAARAKGNDKKNA
jgi:hypothetical protein